MRASYAVIFKTHFWDAFAQRQLERLKARCTHGDVYVVVDETHGEVAKIGHDAAYIVRISEAGVDALALPRFGSNSLFWWNADYPLHLFVAEHPGYDYYVMVEFDVVLNTDLDPIIERLVRDDIDFVADPILDPPIDRFHWLYTAEGVYELSEMEAWLTCISIFSRRAARILLESKKELGERLRAGYIATIPMCEIAIPTALVAAGARMMPLTSFGSTSHYKWTPPYDEGDLPNLTTSDFVHPVLVGKRFVGNFLKWYPEHRDFLDPTTLMWTRFKSQESLEAAFPVLYAEYLSRGHVNDCSRLVSLMRQTGSAEYLRFHGLHEANVALGKRATQSSWVGGGIRPDEASLAVAGVVTGRSSFHTEADERPWWLLDLDRSVGFTEIRVFNRMDEKSRADGLVVSVSENLFEWTEVGRHSGPSFGGADGHPFCVHANCSARFILLWLPRREYLHLDQVQVVAC